MPSGSQGTTLFRRGQRHLLSRTHAETLGQSWVFNAVHLEPSPDTYLHSLMQDTGEHHSTHTWAVSEDLVLTVRESRKFILARTTPQFFLSSFYCNKA